MNDFINAEINKIFDGFLNNPITLYQEFNRERQDVSNYTGREVLEMLQNADDAGKQKKQSKIKFVLNNDNLIVYNTGDPFSKKGVLSLLYSATSEKTEEVETIGQKGLGFRSLLNWGDKIQIISGSLSIEFSKEIAEEYYEKLLNADKTFFNKIQEHTSEKLPVPVLKFPKIIESNVDMSEFDTAVVLYFKEDEYDKIERQLSNVDSKSILFTKNLDEISIQVKDSSLAIIKVKDNENEITVKLIRDEHVESNKYKLKINNGIFEGKNFEIILAKNLSSIAKKNYLYSFFKTKITLPFSLIVHATFDLNSDRNSLVVNDANKFILEEVINQLFSTIKYFYKNPIDIYRNIVIKDGFDESLNDDFNLEQYYLEKLYLQKLFVTVNGKWISFADSPVYHESNFSRIFDKKFLDNFLLHMEGFDYKSQFSYVSKKNYDLRFEKFYYSYVEKLIEDKEDFNPSETALLLSFIREEGFNIYSTPSVFHNLSDRRVKGKRFHYLGDKTLLKNAPSFTEINIIHENYINAIKEKNQIVTEKDLIDYLEYFKVYEYSISQFTKNLVELVNQSDDGTYKEKLDEMLIWIMCIEDEVENKEELFLNIKRELTLLKLPTVTGDLEYAGNLFLSDIYGNELGFSLLKKVKEVRFVAEPNVIWDEDKDTTLKMLEIIGVKRLPGKRTGIKIYDQSELREYINSCYSVNDRIRFSQYTLSKSEFFDNVKSWHLKTDYIEYFDDILKTAKFEDILYWFYKDDMVSRFLDENYERDGNGLIITRKGKRTDDLSKTKIPSYCKWKLKTMKWVPTESGELSAPSICIDIRGTRENLSPVIEYPKVDEKYHLFKRDKINHNTILDLYSKIGIGSKLTELKPNQVYTILSNLHKMDSDGKMAQSIYFKFVVEYETDDLLRNEVERNAFLKDGTVLANYNGEKTYYPLSEVFYIDNRQYSQEVLNRFKMLTLSRRLGERKVNKILGVKPLGDLNFEINGGVEKHILQDEFSRYWKSFIPYAYAFRVEEDSQRQEKSTLLRYKILITESLKVDYVTNDNIETFELRKNEYLILPNKGEVYIVVEDDLFDIEDLVKDWIFADTIAEMITSLLKVEQNRKDFRMLFPLPFSQRKEIISRDFDDEKLVRLEKARNELNLKDVEKMAFWEPILKLKNIEEENLDSYIDSLLFDDNTIDYTNIDENHSIKSVIELFRELNIDVEQYNDRSINEINLVPYYENELLKLKSIYKDIYAVQIYESLVNSNIKDKINFEKIKRKYKQTKFNIVNSVNYNLKEEFVQTFNLAENHTSDINLRDIYKSNFDILLDKIKKRIPDKLMTDNEFISLIYFGVIDYIIDNYKSYWDVNDEPEEKNDEYTTEYLDISEIQTQGIKTRRRKNTKNKKGYISSDTRRKQEKKNQTTGFIAENVVYNSLLRMEQFKNVEWVSGNAAKAGINPEGNDSHGYDIEVITKRGKREYIEVKSSSGEEYSFHISHNELSIASKNKKRYYIYFVTNVGKTSMKIENCGTLFDTESNNIYDSDTYTIEAEDYYVRMKKVYRK